MSANGDDQNDSSRRSFLFSSAGLLTATWLGTHWPAIAAAAHHADAMGAAEAAAPSWTGFQFLSESQARDVEAIAAQIVPGGATPGAREAHAVHFVDRALGTFFSAWSGDFRQGLADFQAEFHAAHADVPSFAAADGATQIAFLTTVEHSPFFDAVRMLTVLGMFSSPKYGGNSSGLGWQLMGFEDRHAFAPPFGYYDSTYAGFVPYPEKPA